MARYRFKQLMAVAVSSAMMLAYLPSIHASELSGEAGQQELAELEQPAEQPGPAETLNPSAAPIEEREEASPAPELAEPAGPAQEGPDQAELEEEEEPAGLASSGMDIGPDEQPVRDENGYIVSTYGYELKGDPYNDGRTVSTKRKTGNYKMTDQDFFGRWNAQTGEWAVKGKFNYDEYPGLANVEAAVKRDTPDYEAAKVALYNYYLKKEREGIRKKDITSATKDRITADLLLKNFMYNANSGIFPAALMYVDGEEKEVECDVTEVVTKYLGARTSLGFIITATDKDGGVAEFYSREAGDDLAPTLNIKVNGTNMILHASGDTYIQAVSNSSKVNGRETKLIAQETAVTDTVNLVSADTSRIYLKFDVSGLTAGDTVTEATLSMTGRNTAKNQKKEVVVFSSDNSSWKEYEDNWGSMVAQVIFSYDQLQSWPWNQPANSGYRFPEELLRFNTWIDKLVKMYNVTHDEKYAYTALRQLMDFIDVTGTSPRHLKLLDVAVRNQVLPGYVMQLLESKYMTPEILTAYLKYSWIEANDYGLTDVNLYDSKGVTANTDDGGFFTISSNWGSSETLGYFTLAINFPEFTDAPKWESTVQKRYSKIVDELMAEDLSSKELALGYVDYTLDTIIGAKKAADSIGYKSYPFTDRTYESVLGLSKFMMYSSMPGYKDMQEGDGYSHRGGYTSRLQYVGEWFKDDHLLFAGSGKGTEPEFKSIMFPIGKKAAMRTGWDSKANYLYASVDGGVGNHAHQDDNNLVVSAYGQYMLVDPLYGSYDVNDNTKWLKSAKAHNVVTFNGGGQTIGSRQGTIDRWETNDTYDFWQGTSPNLSGAGYTRKILFIKPGFWLVNDYLTPTGGGTNTYVQNWHFLPEANITLDSKTGITRTNIKGPNIQVVPVEYNEMSKASIVTGLYSEGQGSFLDAKYIEYEKKLSGNAVYNTVLYPENVGMDHEIVTNQIDVQGVTAAEASAYELFITDKKTNEMSRYQNYILNDTGKQAKRSVGAHTTDASMLFAELDQKGTTKNLIAQDASLIQNNESGAKIFQSDSSISELSLDWSMNNVTIKASSLTEDILKENNVAIYNQGNRITRVMLNGTAIDDFKKTANYVYFGDTPPENADPDPDVSPTPKPTSKPQHGGGSGGGGGGGGGTVIPPSVTAQPGASPNPSGTPEPGTGPREMSPGMQAELSGHWAEREISSLYQQGIITGITEDSLGLDQKVTRAEFVTLIVRALGLEVPEYQGGFTDVSDGDWYAGAIQAAADNGLLSGYGGQASPNAPITREEMAKILSAASDLAGVNLGTGGDLSRFTDAGEISDWAAGDIAKVVSGGLMNGLPDGAFAPKVDTRRDEAFVVVYRLLEQIK